MAMDAEGVQIEVQVETLDEPLVASPMANLYASLAVMLLSRKIDLFHPTGARRRYCVSSGPAALSVVHAHSSETQQRSDPD